MLGRHLACSDAEHTSSDRFLVWCKHHSVALPGLFFRNVQCIN